jgi:O-antigen/teichoic acid export membrane protein
VTDVAGRAPLAYPSTRRALALGVWGKVAEVASLALLVTVVPRLLGPSDYGSFALGLSVVLLGSTALAISGPAVMSRFVGAAVPEQRAAIARALAFRALRWRAGGLAAVVAAAAAIVVLDPARLSAFAAASVLLAIVLDAPATITFQIALAFGRVDAWSFRYPLQNLVLVIAALTLHELLGVNGALFAITLASAVALAAGLALVMRPLRAQARAGRTHVPREVSRFAFLQGWSNVLLQLQHRGGVVVVALLAGSRTQTAYAGLATALGAAATYAVWQLFTVTMPRFALTAATDAAAVDASLRRLTKVALLLTAPAAVASVPLLRPLLPAVLGPNFAGARNAFVPVLAAIPPAAITGVVASASSVYLRPGARLLTMLAGATAFLVVAGASVPAHGATGATTAVLAASVASALAGAALFPQVVAKRLVVFAFAASALVILVAAFD